MNRTTAISFLFLSFVFQPVTSSAACNECHSKNPKMVRMHEALGFKDCFKCHGIGQLKKGEEQKTQMRTDPLCTNCHK